ncbi:MAG: GNAT family N-acetyltransferase [Pyrinomonadaceae bacterium]
MKIVEQIDLSNAQKTRIIKMWNVEYPLSLAHSGISSFDEYLEKLGDKRHFLLVDSSGEIVGWAMLFERDEAHWFAIIVDGSVQGKGLGIKLLDALKSVEKNFFGWVIAKDDFVKANGEKYRSPLGFYKKIGFNIHENEKLVKQNISGIKIEWNGRA